MREGAYARGAEFSVIEPQAAALLLDSIEAAPFLYLLDALDELIEVVGIGPGGPDAAEDLGG